MISLISEMTDGKGRHARGWLFYDSDCEFCTWVAALCAPPIRKRGMDVAPLQDPRVAVLLGISRQELLRAIRLVYGDGRRFEGADAMLAVAQEVWWARPLVWVAQFPRAMSAMRGGYRWWARSRRCRSGER